MASKKVLEHYLRQLRLIEEHREKWCEQNVRRHYRDCMKDLQEFLGVEYAQLAQDDKLTFEILHSKGQYARFIEEVERRVNKFTPEAAQEIRNTVQLTYQKTFEGMVKAVEKSKTYEELKINLAGLKAATPDIIKNAVSNTFLEDALEKNHKTIIYDIKQQIGVGLSQGDRMSTMARRISEQLDKDYKKATQIVRTECHRVREAGFQDSSERISQKLKDSDSDYVMTKTWKTMQDLSVRPYRKKGKGFAKGKGPDHSKMHGVTVLVDDVFTLEPGVTAKAPGQSGVAGHDINCRCYLSRDLMLKSEYEKISGKKLETYNPAEKYEAKEQKLLDNKDTLIENKETLELQKLNLESKEYEGIWKDKVTVADYESKKDKIQAKRDYYNTQIANFEDLKAGKITSTFYGPQDADIKIAEFKNYLKLLDDFEAQGKTYLKILDNIKDVSVQISDIDDQIFAIRQKIMKAKGIDIDKMQEEINDLTAKINKLASSSKNLTLKSKLNEYNTTGLKKAFMDANPNMTEEYFDKITKWYANTDVKTVMEYFIDSDNQTDFKKALKKLAKADPENAKKLKKLQEELADKSDELEKIRKRYGLVDETFSQARKDAAYWFTNENGGAKAADAVLREKCGEIWSKATAAQKKTAYEYTVSYHKYNEPLRGIEYGTNKFLGVGNVDLDKIGVGGYGNFKQGEVKKLIDDLTDVIDKSTYGFDIWVQRGCGYGGMDKFFNIDANDFYNLTEKEMQNKLIGTTPTEYAFMSTGVSKGKGLNVSGQGITLNIYAPKGTKMLYCEPFSAFGNGAGKSWDGKSTQSSFGHEAEMLLQRNTMFRVTKVEKSGSRWYVDMEVISQER